MNSILNFFGLNNKTKEETNNDVTFKYLTGKGIIVAKPIASSVILYHGIVPQANATNTSTHQSLSNDIKYSSEPLVILRYSREMQMCESFIIPLDDDDIKLSNDDLYDLVHVKSVGEMRLHDNAVDENWDILSYESAKDVSESEVMQRDSHSNVFVKIIVYEDETLENRFPTKDITSYFLGNLSEIKIFKIQDIIKATKTYKFIKSNYPKYGANNQVAIRCPDIYGNKLYLAETALLNVTLLDVDILPTRSLTNAEDTSGSDDLEYPSTADNSVEDDESDNDRDDENETFTTISDVSSTTTPPNSPATTD